MSTPLDESLFGGCAPPFYNTSLSSFDTFNRLYTDGRYCLPETTCCLPCPVTQFVYSPGTSKIVEAEGILSTVSFFTAGFVLLSYAVLHPAYTRCSYERVSIIASVMLINFGFMVTYLRGSCSPSTAPYVVCADPVTPHDMHSSAVCALSGISIVLGSLAMATWAVITSVVLHMELFLQKRPGNLLAPTLRLLGWAIPVGLTTAAISITGVSFRLGPGACHINLARSVPTFWIWIIAFIGLAVVVQIWTWSWVVWLYIKVRWFDDRNYLYQTDTDSQVLLRELKKAARSQWRLIVMLSGMLVIVICFVTVFFRLDKQSYNNNPAAGPWLACLINHPLDPNSCYALAQAFLVSENTLEATLLLFSILGIPICGLVLNRNFFHGWRVFFQALIMSVRGAPLTVHEGSDHSDTPRSGPSVNQSNVDARMSTLRQRPVVAHELQANPAIPPPAPGTYELDAGHMR